MSIELVPDCRLAQHSEQSLRQQPLTAAVPLEEHGRVRRHAMPSAPQLFRVALLVVASALLLAGPASALTASRCAAIAGHDVPVVHVALGEAATPSGPVRITFVGHATFRVESPGGVLIATDYAGFAGRGRVPDVVTMNHAHETHYTLFPDRRIAHVLEGWGDESGPARHDVVVGDVHIRNVPTDIRAAEGLREKDGNSIFIFEVAGLCIGHLGHLHHTLGPEHLGQIGQLDIVMVPVDGSFTMAQSSMVEVLDLLKARIVLPMHYFSQRTLDAFLIRLGLTFDVVQAGGSTIEVTPATLPARKTVIVLTEQSPLTFE